MTAAQTALYFREWNAVREILRRQGVSAKDCHAKRHELHVEALGAQKSSKAFSNRDLDKVLAIFRRYSRPEDIGAQLRAATEQRKRTIYALDALLARLGKSREYAETIARTQGASTVDWDRMPDDELRAVLSALTVQTRRKRKFTTAPTTAPMETVPAEGDDEGDDEGDPF